MKRFVFVVVFIFLVIFCFAQDFDSAYHEFNINYDWVDDCERMADDFEWVGPSSEVIYFSEGKTLIFSKDKSFAVFIEYFSDRVKVTYKVAPGKLSDWLATRSAEMCLDYFAWTGGHNIPPSHYIVYTTFK